MSFLAAQNVIGYDISLISEKRRWHFGVFGCISLPFAFLFSDFRSGHGEMTLMK